MIKPLKNNIIIKLIEEKEEKTQGGILLPKPQRKTKKYKIINLGEAVSTVKKGDIVMIESHAGYKVEYGAEADETLLLIHEADIIAVVG